ncbi:MAG TPA: DinB family protein [Gemmataceae bacterium]|nr:DinB family protein [Gemmataceae bacterium]
MVEYVKQILTGQFEAALCMLNKCVEMCPQEHWEAKIANNTFRQVAYHTLFFVDAYLSPSEEAFELRDLHCRGGDERLPASSPGLSKDETLAYLAICRQKMLERLAFETAESLQGPSRFPRRPASRGELHIYNIRHVQHHTGQLSAYLRRLGEAFRDFKVLPWVGTGWR